MENLMMIVQPQSEIISKRREKVNEKKHDFELKQMK